MADPEKPEESRGCNKISIFMKKLFVVLSFLAVGAFLPTSSIQACAGEIQHCNELEQVIIEATQNCLCGGSFIAVDVCNGNSRVPVHIEC